MLLVFSESILVGRQYSRAKNMDNETAQGAWLVPQTELAMRGSYGVAKERGHELFVAAVAPAGCRFLL